MMLFVNFSWKFQVFFCVRLLKKYIMLGGIVQVALLSTAIKCSTTSCNKTPCWSLSIFGVNCKYCKRLENLFSNKTRIVFRFSAIVSPHRKKQHHPIAKCLLDIYIWATQPLEPIKYDCKCESNGKLLTLFTHLWFDHFHWVEQLSRTLCIPIGIMVSSSLGSFKLLTKCESISNWKRFGKCHFGF